MPFIEVIPVEAVWTSGAFSQSGFSMRDVTEKVWLRAMYSDGIAAQTRKTEGDLKTEG